MCKLSPMSGDIKVVYTTKAHPEYGETTSHHKTYEDFGEWLCRHFAEINLINVDHT